LSSLWNGKMLKQHVTFQCRHTLTHSI
jgi:hypothetical protein